MSCHSGLLTRVVHQWPHIVHECPETEIERDGQWVRKFFSGQYFLSAISHLQDNTSDSHVSPILPLCHLSPTGQHQWLTCQSNPSSQPSLNYRTTPVTHMSVQYFLPAISHLQDNTSHSHVSPILPLCDLSTTGQHQWLTCQSNTFSLRSLNYRTTPVTHMSVQYFFSAISHLQDNNSDSHVRWGPLKAHLLCVDDAVGLQHAGHEFLQFLLVHAPHVVELAGISLLEVPATTLGVNDIKTCGYLT